MKIFTLASALAFTAASAMAAPHIGFVVYDGMNDDDEVAAKEWFVKQPNAALVNASDLATVTVAEYPVLWVMVDQLGLAVGHNNLPSDISVSALNNYVHNGGKLYLSNHAAQLADPLGFTPSFTPGVFGSGDGGTGDDIWTINPFLGFDFRPEGNRPGFQPYYDKSGHEVLAGLTLDNHNGWDQRTLALIGPGHREDHNCIWDCNIPGAGSEADVIANFEKNYNANVIATWGHVQDHCVAGLVDFNNGQCVVNGFAAYEWNQNSNPNPYQDNIHALTSNILNYLAKGVDFTGASAVQVIGSNGQAEYYTLQGVRVAEPTDGLYIMVKDGKATKLAF